MVLLLYLKFTNADIDLPIKLNSTRMRGVKSSGLYINECIGGVRLEDLISAGIIAQHGRWPSCVLLIRYRWALCNSRGTYPPNYITPTMQSEQHGKYALVAGILRFRR